MRCEDCREKLADLVEGLLSVPEKAEVDAHAAGCDGCGAELAALRLAVSWLETDVSVEPPAALCANVMSRIAASGPVGGAGQASSDRLKAAAEPVRRGWLSVPWLVGGLAAALPAAASVVFVASTKPPASPGGGIVVDVIGPSETPSARPVIDPSATPLTGAIEPQQRGPMMETGPGDLTTSAPGQAGAVKPEAAPGPPAASVASPVTPRQPATVRAASDLGPTARPVTRTMSAATATTATPPRTGPASPSAPRPGPVRTIGDGF